MVDIPGYKVLRQLGRGGMATVYLAVQALVEREVALKVMAPQLTVDPSFGERFLREARIAAKLRHPNIVSIIEVGVHGDYHYAAMEYLHGGPIISNDGDTLPLPRVLRAVREIAGALDYAHSKGVVHRDVKPDNILVREDGSAVLGDFGIARAVDASGAVTRTGTVVGTPLYMSPEQLRGKHVDGRSDLYSLGVVCFQLLSGRPPYMAEDALALGIMHMTSPIPALPGVFVKAQGLVSKLLAKDPGDRFQSGADVVAEITALEAEISEPGSVAPRQMRAEPRAGRSVDADLRVPRGGRSEPTIGAMNEAVADRWRVTPRPQGKQARRGGKWLALLLIISLIAAAWWQQALWWPPVRAWVDQQLGVDDQRLEQFRELLAKGELIRSDGKDGLAVLAELLAEEPDDAQALGGLASAWPQLLNRLQELDRSDRSAAAKLRERLLRLRPGDSALKPKLATTAALPTPASNPSSVSSNPSSVSATANNPTQSNAAAGTDSTISAAQRQAAIDRHLAAARVAERDRRWYGEDGALGAYRAVLELQADQEVAHDGLLRLIDRILIDAREALQRRQQSEPARAAVAAFADLAEAKSAHDELVRLLELADRRGAGADRSQRIAAALQASEQLLRRGKPGDQALLDVGDQLAVALSLDRRDSRLREAIDQIAAILLVRASEKIEAGDSAAAEAMLSRARALTPDSALLEDLQIRVVREPAGA